jgi:dTDP-4-dehydrorhamnose 3,5-epimerase-like enzyme
MKETSIHDCKLIDLRKIHDVRGNLTPIEGGMDVPFDIKRVYYLYDVPGGESRGAHAHRELYQLIVAASGSFTVTLDDGTEKKSFNLNRSYYGLLVVPGIWRDLDDFSSGAVLLCLASEHYDESDYVRCYADFKKISGNGDGI